MEVSFPLWFCGDLVLASEYNYKNTALAIAEVLNSYGNIYGFDDEHVEILDYIRNGFKGDVAKQGSIKFIFTTDSILKITDALDGLGRIFVDFLDVLSVKISKLHGTLYSCDFSVLSKTPLLVLNQILISKKQELLFLFKTDSFGNPEFRFFGSN